jgi:NAD(P)-dependent dehydrogenase (short-subunit alcohol dehydrogenase family)
MFEDDGAGATWSGCSGIPDRTAEEIKQMRDRFSSVIPLGRLGKVDDALGFIEFLVSDQSTYSTGEVYTLTGGISVRI